MFKYNKRKNSGIRNRQGLNKNSLRTVYKKNLRVLCGNLLLFILCAGCEKEIPIDFPDHTSRLVVEGWIEQGKGAKVLLSYSAPFFNAVDSSNIRDYAALRAKVTVSNGTDSIVLVLKPNDVFFPPYYYFESTLQGKINEEYTLIIEDKGNIYTAKTTIPEPLYPDSTWFELEPENDSLGKIWIRLKDDPLKDNYYRTLVKRLGKDNRFIPTLISAFDDKLFNGETITLSFSRGSSNLLDVSEDCLFELGDTLVFKFCIIDKVLYNFWHSLQNSILTSANPFAANVGEIQSNIKNGLGIWGGYAAVYDTIITGE